MKRPLLYLGIAIIFALFIWGIERPDMTSQGDASYAMFVKDYDATKVSKIEIEKLINGVQLKTADGNNWEVAEFITPLKEKLVITEEREPGTSEWQKAKNLSVTQALGRFGSLQQGVLVAKLKDRHRLYGVDETGLKVRVFDKSGKEVFDVIIGKNGPNFDSNYVRRNGEDEVYLVDRSLQGIFSISVDDWKTEAKTP